MKLLVYKDLQQQKLGVDEVNYLEHGNLKFYRERLSEFSIKVTGNTFFFIILFQL